MRLSSATVCGLQLPFVEAFRHAAMERTCSDSVIVGLSDDAGHRGFGGSGRRRRRERRLERADGRDEVRA